MFQCARLKGHFPLINSLYFSNYIALQTRGCPARRLASRSHSFAFASLSLITRKLISREIHAALRLECKQQRGGGLLGKQIISKVGSVIHVKRCVCISKGILDTIMILPICFTSSRIRFRNCDTCNHVHISRFARFCP